MRFLGLGAVLLVAGCASWVRPDTTPEQAQRDEAECGYQANFAPGADKSPARWADIKWQCMEMKGYQRELKSQHAS